MGMSIQLEFWPEYEWESEWVRFLGALLISVLDTKQIFNNSF
jgi:hypothetical protein